MNHTSPVSSNPKFIIPVLPVQSTGIGVTLAPGVYQQPAQPPSVFFQHFAPALRLPGSSPGHPGYRREEDAAAAMVALSLQPVHRQRNDPSCPLFSAIARMPESVSLREGMNAMVEAILVQDTGALDRLIRPGVPVNLCNEFGKLPLAVAAAKGNTQAMGLLLHAGADPNLAAPSGLTPLFFAVFTGQLRPVEMLLQAGAVATTRSYGHTALDLARLEGHREIEQLLNQYEQAQAARRPMPHFHFNLAVQS